MIMPTKEEMDFIISLCEVTHPDLNVFINDLIEYSYSLPDRKRQLIVERPIKTDHIKNNHFSMIETAAVASVEKTAIVLLKDQGFHPWIITHIDNFWSDVRHSDFHAISYDHSILQKGDPFDRETPNAKAFNYGDVILSIWSLPLSDEYVQEYINAKISFMDAMVKINML